MLDRKLLGGARAGKVGSCQKPAREQRRGIREHERPLPVPCLEKRTGREGKVIEESPTRIAKIHSIGRPTGKIHFPFPTHVLFDLSLLFGPSVFKLTIRSSSLARRQLNLRDDSSGRSSCHSGRRCLQVPARSLNQRSSFLGPLTQVDTLSLSRGLVCGLATVQRALDCV